MVDDVSEDRVSRDQAAVAYVTGRSHAVPIMPTQPASAAHLTTGTRTGGHNPEGGIIDFPAVSRYSPAMREVRKRSYDIMKCSLEKRLSDAELPIAGLSLCARLCMVSSCYSLMAKSCRVNTVKA